MAKGNAARYNSSMKKTKEKAETDTKGKAKGKKSAASADGWGTGRGTKLYDMDDSDAEDDNDGDHDDDVDGASNGGDGDDDGDDSKDGVDGFASMMNKILTQNVSEGSKSVPILAKRKTAIMKEIEKDIEDKIKVKKLRIEKKIEREKQLDIPDMTTMTFEKGLKKIATKGVVALFNAISKAKRDNAAVESEDNGENDSLNASGSNGLSKKNSKRKKESSKSIKDMTQENFLEMLKPSTSSSSSQNGSSNAKSNSISAVDSKADTWNVLKDDYLLESKLSLKNWDKDSDDDEGNGDDKCEKTSKKDILQSKKNMSIEDPFLESRASDSNKKRDKKKTKAKKGDSDDDDDNY